MWSTHSRRTEELSTDTEHDSPKHFHNYNFNMIITLIILVVDYLVLELNQQRLLKYHALFIGVMVIRLWRYHQPLAYTITEQGVRRVKPTGGIITQQKIWNKCSVCLAIKPARYYHCRRCQKCIYRMDHHCQWIGNCIGLYNAKVYLHLLINVFLHCLALFIISVVNYSQLLDYSRYQIYYLLTGIPVIYGLYESHRLIRDFWDSVKNNQTLIQSYKRVIGENTHFMQNWQAYMGRNAATWLIPTFIQLTNCDLLQPTFSEAQDQLQSKQYIYADEYMYGSDDEEQYQQLMKEQ